MCTKLGLNVPPSIPEDKTVKASDYIQHIDDINNLGRPLLAVAYMRVSKNEQRTKHNLRNRMKALRLELKKRGIKIARKYTEAVSGRDLENRVGLTAALKAAQSLQEDHPKSDVVIVTDARNRFLRGSYYNGTASTDLPPIGQFNELAHIANGIRLATILNPDESFRAVRSYETNIPTTLGLASGKKVGRKKNRDNKRSHHRRGALSIRMTKQNLMQPLKSGGKSNREIASILGVTEGTIRNWLIQLSEIEKSA